MKKIEQKKLQDVTAGYSTSSLTWKRDILCSGGPNNKLSIQTESDEEFFIFYYAGKSYEISTNYNQAIESDEFKTMIRDLNPHYYKVEANNNKVKNILILF